MIIEIPRPPSVNGLYRNVAGRGRVKTLRYRTWIRAAGNEINAQRPLEPISGPYVAEITVDKGRADLDGLAKGPLDLLVALGLTPDDKHLQRLTMIHQAGSGCIVKVEAA
jgi:Holliday junction resolvase RusA-like endonuclease